MPYGRRRTRRRSSARAVIQSFKKVINTGPSSRPATTKVDFDLADGVDSVAAGQTSAVDVDVPTGSVIRGFEIQYCAQNLVNIAAFLHVSIQHLRSGQTSIDPRVIGGDPQRNQVFWQRVYCIGQNQNVNIVRKFKVPSKFGRVRDGDKWVFTVISSQVYTDTYQAIYKFYR